jgi:transmembrane sensor
VRLQSEELPKTEREQFVDWLRESQLHVAEMLRVAKVHDALEQSKSWHQISTDGPDEENENVVALTAAPTAGQRLGAPSRQSRVWAGLVAAGLAAVALAGWMLHVRAQLIETERGERREVALSDGSVLQVDPETRIRLAFEPKLRRVILERGRALFRVAKNPDRPFLVEADGTTVRAVGTAFGVERQEGGVIVTVAEGKVGVYSTEASPNGDAQLPRRNAQDATNRAGVTTSASSGLKSPARTEIFLTAGEQVKMEPGSAEPVRVVDSDRELAWAKGRLVFDNQTVADAVTEFNRYNRIQLKAADRKLGSRLVSGVFDASDPESFIAFLQTVTSVQIKRTEREVVME